MQLLDLMTSALTKARIPLTDDQMMVVAGVLAVARFAGVPEPKPAEPRARAAVYVFRDAECKALGFTMSSQLFKSRAEADTYARDFAHTKVVEW